MATQIHWNYDERSGDYVAEPSGAWRVFVTQRWDGRWDAIAEWGDTYMGAPTGDVAREKAEALIRARFGLEG